MLVDKHWRANSKLTDRNVILVKRRVVFDGTGSELRVQPATLSQLLGGSINATA